MIVVRIEVGTSIIIEQNYKTTAVHQKNINEMWRLTYKLFTSNFQEMFIIKKKYICQLKKKQFCDRN